MPQDVLQLVLGEAGGGEGAVLLGGVPHGEVAAEHDAVGAPHARELYRAALSQEELRAGFVKEHAIVHGHLVQDVVTHLVARPTAEMRRVHYQVGERAQDVHQAARVREVVTIVSRVDDHGQS